jgi:hypothetical protein
MMQMARQAMASQLLRMNASMVKPRWAVTFWYLKVHCERRQAREHGFHQNRIC